jgi:kynureninase
VPSIREASTRLTRRILELVDEFGFHTVASRDPARLAGAVAVAVPDALAVARTLNARDIVVDYRPDVGIRVAPHVYNTADEVEKAMATIDEIVRTKRYSPPTDSIVT